MLTMNLKMELANRLCTRTEPFIRKVQVEDVP